MPSTYRIQRAIYEVLPFGLVSFVFSSAYSLIEKGILGDYSFYPSTGNPYTFNWLIPSLTAGIFGLFIGFLEMRFISQWFKKGSFALKVIFKSSIYISLMVTLIILVTSFGNAYELGSNPFSAEVWKYNIVFLTSFAFWTIVFYITLGIVISLFYTEVSNIIGHDVLWNLFTGRYHRPVEEERIFMFLDMKSSTAIAEKLGHTKYFDLLKSYYSDLSDAIVDCGGTIYQYVGDEVVVMWKSGIGSSSASIDCFLEMKKSLSDKKEKYLSEFGVAPTFKAGIHAGLVTSGEIGKIKKEVVFTGDLLNTTARIQGLCNEYQVDLLISEALVNQADLRSFIKLREVVDEAELRGRNETVRLFTLETD
ncbi:MAG: adenylate/guanylate cyclase domain-containing protein [Bacteroidota bacterium]